MVLVPVGNAGQRYIIAQLLKVDLDPRGTEPDALGSIADAQHAHSFARDETPLAKGLQGIAAAIVLGDHAEAGRTAVHGVKLKGEGEFVDQGSNNLYLFLSTSVCIIIFLCNLKQ